MSKIVRALSTSFFFYNVKAATSTTGYLPERGFYHKHYFYEIEPVWTDAKGNLVEHWSEELEREFQKLE